MYRLGAMLNRPGPDGPGRPDAAGRSGYGTELDSGPIPVCTMRCTATAISAATITPYLTYNDLYDMQAYLTETRGSRNESLDRLMAIQKSLDGCQRCNSVQEIREQDHAGALPMAVRPRLVWVWSAGWGAAWARQGCRALRTIGRKPIGSTLYGAGACPRCRCAVLLKRRGRHP